MKGFVAAIESLTEANADFRRVLYTGKHSQLVLMALKPGEEIGEEVHEVDQFFRFEEGTATVIIDGVKHAVTAGDATIVPAGAKHNVIAVDSVKLYTLYAPPNHRDSTIHRTKRDAEANEEHFDGKTTE